MNGASKVHKLIARVLIVATTCASVVPRTDAAAIATETAIASDRQRILQLVQRSEVRAQLQAYGVKPSEVEARVAVLTDAEVGQLAAAIDSAPAAGKDRLDRVGEAMDDIHAGLFVLALVALLILAVLNAVFGQSAKR